MIFIGISPGTRSFGLALIKGAELVLWKTFTFKGAWSLGKLKYVEDKIVEILSPFPKAKVACKIPRNSNCSEGVPLLIKRLNCLFEERQIPTQCFSGKELCARYHCPNSYSFIQLAQQYYPELKSQCEKEVKNLNPYHAKTIEAVLLARLLSTQEDYI